MPSEGDISFAKRHPEVTVCVTVRNEQSNIRNLVQSLQAQTYQWFELVVVDGGSVDGTYELLVQLARDVPFPMFVLSIGGNISVGRNRAVAAARTELILTTDAGTRLPARWVGDMVQPMLAESGRWVAGSFEADPRAVGWHRSISTLIIPSKQEFRAGTVLPSARSVGFAKAAWETAGRFPEDLPHCEDLVFFSALREVSGSELWVTTCPVEWDARKTPRLFYRQYYLYARGDALANIYAGRNAGRFAFYALLGISFLKRNGSLCAALLLTLLRRPMTRALHSKSFYGHRVLTPPNLFRIAASQILGDFAKMHGYLSGRWFKISSYKRELHPREHIK